jgi:DNA-binding NarL/FixJ family response regulator
MDEGSEMTSILVVEDHSLLVSALLRILRERGGYEVPAVASSAEQALEQLPSLHVDLALVDISLPRMNGIDLVALIRMKYPKLPCLMLSGHASQQYVERSMLAGASGYVLKEDVPGIILAIREVLQGGTYISSGLTIE